MAKKVKRAVFRSRFYYAMGISIISLPLTFLGFSRNLYGLVDNLPFFRFIFPTFQHFLLIGGIGLIPFSIFLGYLWIKSPFYKEERRAPAENNPFAFQLAPGRDTTLYFGQVVAQKNMLRVFKQLGTITEEEETQYQQYIKLMEYLNQGGSLREYLSQ